MGSVSNFVKLLLRVAILVGIVQFLLVNIASENENGGRKMKHMITTDENQKSSDNRDLNYITSKRKVPNGPDPIHNRRAGNSHRPPGQA